CPLSPRTASPPPPRPGKPPRQGHNPPAPGTPPSNRPLRGAAAIAILMTRSPASITLPMQATVIAALALAATTIVAAATEYSDIDSRRANERRIFTDAEITEGF